MPRVLRRMTAWRIGTAGWAIPRHVSGAFPGESGTLQRYAARFGAVEINSSFHRPHRPSTYARWADSVPAGFRFAVKLPKAITHVRRLADCADELEAFAAGVAELREKRGAMLVQLPPSLAFDSGVAAAFFTEATRILGCSLVCEPRHPSWFARAADDLLRRHRVARVAADPAAVADGGVPGGWPGLAYFRLHGAPRTYWSSYGEEALRLWADRAREVGAVEVWVMFDNTAGGAAAANALRFMELVAEPPE